MSETTQAEPVTAEHFVLAEGPVWDAARSRLLWVDIPTGRVLQGRWEQRGLTCQVLMELGQTVGAVVSAADGTLLVAGQRALLIDGVTPLVEVLSGGVDSRLNDGACDPAGRFCVGSLALDGRTGEEGLYRLNSTGTVSTFDADLTLSNGLAWSPDGSLMYSIDSIPGTVWVRSYEASTGQYGPRRILFAVEAGIPDGMCVDADGCLWVAVWGRGQVRRYSPAGDVLHVVNLAASQPTSVAFTGPDLDRLVITSARQGLSPKDLARTPDAGRLFVAEVPATGLPTEPWVPIIPDPRPADERTPPCT